MDAPQTSPLTRFISSEDWKEFDNNPLKTDSVISEDSDEKEYEFVLNPSKAEPMHWVNKAYTDASLAIHRYFITWNPDDRKLNLYGLNIDPKRKWSVMILQVLQHLHKSCRYFCIVPELAPTTGRLHCHGWIAVTDMIKWQKSVLPKLRKTVMVPQALKIVPIRKWSEKCLEYCTKDIMVAYNVLFPHIIPYTHDTNYVAYRQITDAIEKKLNKKGKFFDFTKWGWESPAD